MYNFFSEFTYKGCHRTVLWIHSVWQSVGPFMLLQMASLRSFSWLPTLIYKMRNYLPQFCSNPPLIPPSSLLALFYTSEIHIFILCSLQMLYTCHHTKLYLKVNSWKLENSYEQIKYYGKENAVLSRTKGVTEHTQSET